MLAKNVVATTQTASDPSVSKYFYLSSFSGPAAGASLRDPDQLPVLRHRAGHGPGGHVPSVTCPGQPPGPPPC